MARGSPTGPRSGRIRQTADGLIDSEQADADWVRNTHPAPRAPRVAPVPVTDDFGFSRARGVREHYEALLAKVEYEKRVGELLRADEVKVARYRIDEAFREHMFRVPDAVISKLRAHIREHSASPDEHNVHTIVTAAIRTALEAFCDEMVAGAA